MLDNSALGWTLNIQQSGVRTAPPRGAQSAGASAGEEAQAERTVLVPDEPVTVQRGEAFVSFYPGPYFKLTAGVDAQDDAAVIGQQWYSWRVHRDYHYRYELAPARAWLASPDKLFALRAAGLAKGGSEATLLLGNGARWWDPLLARFPANEPARHALLQLVGALALLGAEGGSGVPCGHVVAFNADHALLLDFARALAASCEGKPVLADASDVFEAQVKLMRSEAAARGAAGELRRKREAVLERLGGPAGSGEQGAAEGEDWELEEGEEEEEGQGAQ